jgi:hypothetical protein
MITTKHVNLQDSLRKSENRIVEGWLAGGLVISTTEARRNPNRAMKKISRGARRHSK